MLKGWKAQPKQMDPRCPCTRACQDRSAACHSTCRAYLEYEDAKKAGYAARDRRREANDTAMATTDACRRKMRQLQRERQRLGKRLY